MGEAGGGEGMAGERHSGALVKRANPESLDSPMCNCTSEVWSFEPSWNDGEKPRSPHERSDIPEGR
jgi:hypothetical protein